MREPELGFPLELKLELGPQKSWAQRTREERRWRPADQR